MYVCISKYIYMCVCVCICICIFIYTVSIYFVFRHYLFLLTFICLHVCFFLKLEGFGLRSMGLRKRGKGRDLTWFVASEFRVQGLEFGVWGFEFMA